MKKFNILQRTTLFKVCTKKIFRIMKISMFLLFVTIFNVIGNSSYSQSTRLNLDMKDVPMQAVLKAIEGQSEFFFLYSSKMIDVNQKVDINVSDKKINEVLDELLANKDIKYSVRDRQILLVNDEAELALALQQNKVTGVVSDKSGSPLPGVNVVVTGTTQGTVTDISGKYSIDIPKGSQSLTFSFIGMDQQVITIGALSQINVTMAESAIGLDEVVVIGYGTQSRGLLTASTASVNTSQLKDRAVVSFAEAMVGQVAGVQIQQTTGAPGGGMRVKIRGVGSITSGSQPLYVVDGIAIDNVISTSSVSGWTGQQAQNPMASINPNDIQSIDILKDASSTAIYGSRGSNGVVLITTKQGAAGKPVFSLNISSGIQTLAKKVDMMNVTDYIEMETNRRNAQWVLFGAGTNRQATDPNSVRGANGYKIPVEFSNPANFKQTDWQDEMFRSAPMTTAQLSVSGGSDKVHYYLSGDVVDQDGIIMNTGFKKVSLRANVDATVNDRLKIGFKINPSYSTSNITQAGGYGGTIAHGILNLTPILSPYNADGTYNYTAPKYTYGDGTFDNPTFNNPIAQTLENDMLFEQVRLLSSVYATVEIVKNLIFKSSIGTDINSFAYTQFQPTTAGRPGTIDANGSLSGSRNMNWINENTLTYARTFNGKHNINLLAGVTEQQSFFDYHDMYANGFPNDQVHTLNAGIVYAGSSRESEWSLLSVLARASYDYDKKYLFSATIRRDGSSRFGANNKWGTFPSASIGWRVSQEDFMKSISAISELKVRGSFGITGNNDISDYASIGAVGSQNYILGGGNGVIVNGLVQNSISNLDLGWEQTKEFDFGLELGLFSNRIYLNTDIYNKLTTGLLLSVPVPLITGFESALQNIGEVRNKGVEIVLETKNIVRPDFQWNSNFNISFNKNIVESMGLTNAPIIVGPRNFFNELAYITTVGQPIGSFYGYIVDGVYMTQAEADADPAKFPKAGAGDFNFRDISGVNGVPDGKMDAYDQTVIGHSNPDFIWGFTNTLNYKGIDLGITLQGVQGAQVMNGQKRNTYRWFSGQDRNYWKSEAEPGDGNTPRPGGIGQNRNVSTWWLEDGSYTRVKNVTLGYNIPVKYFADKISRARVYVNAQNLFTFTKYPLFNPEVNSGEGDDYMQLTPGLDFGGYPIARTITFGLNISF
jgi:TonB-linked SusC/RagA family outer membrane protein